eukprot:2041272-Amphidinium_carterae.1
MPLWGRTLNLYAHHPNHDNGGLGASVFRKACFNSFLQALAELLSAMNGCDLRHLQDAIQRAHEARVIMRSVPQATQRLEEKSDWWASLYEANLEELLDQSIGVPKWI